MNRIDAGQLLRMLESGYSIPPLSAIALRLLETASNENASSEQIVSLIEEDPALTVRLLNLSNSALFGTGCHITTLSRAVMRLGHNQIKLMALSISVRDAFPMGKVEQFDYELFWRVSLYRGLIAKSLADQSKTVNPEEAFLGGLTMEIGLPILFDLCIRGQNGQFSLDLEPLEELLGKEKACYGLNHREVGAAALKFWKFPEQIAACQEIDAEKRPNSSQLLAVCRLARLFSRFILKGPRAFGSFYSEAEAILGLSPEDIHEAVFNTLAEVEQIAQGFKLHIDSEKEMIGILENANRALVRISQTISRSPEEGPQRILPSFASIDKEDSRVKDTLQAIAHEIRNPLTTVGGFARRLASSLDPESESGKFAKVILEEALRLEKILSEMPEQSVVLGK